ncbi:NAD-dependent epimerase/dehydratase family protein [Soonwooa sp.]|uniref:NAD-dependent epimerase/dehydratase family protein n=1 Tax=Soonwooa sp. TaxID=1938592 RepID=UPI0028A727A5|nr:NAD-dependent epimerase/dehydratase family protein [Soonwooa sp.]
MVVGKGLIASLFSDCDRHEVVFFASGVSNSSETSKANFDRENTLVTEVLQNNIDKLFVYFSTCSIYHSSKYNSPYVLQKLHMEEIINQNASNYLILRVSNAVGKGGDLHLLVNYLHRQIASKKPINIHKNATRNLMDVEDIKQITLDYITKKKYNHILNLAYPENFHIAEVVEILEEELATQAIKHFWSRCICIINKTRHD